MLDINWSDVINTIRSVQTQLIVIAVVLVLALIITFAVNKRTVSTKSTRKFVHAQSWILAAVVAIVSISTMLFGPLYTLLSLASGSGSPTDETIDEASQLAVDIQSEGTVLLKNDNSSLPLSTDAVNVFGWASTNPIYGGTGSGAMNDQYATTSIIQGMNDAGIQTNTELADFYTNYRSERPTLSMAAQEWTLPEPPSDDYSDDLMNDAKDFSDTAVVVIARSGGEGFDLPSDMGNMGDTRQLGEAESATINPGETTDAVSFYQNNSADYADFEDGQSYLELSRTERNMLDLVTSNFSNVVLVYNGANTLSMSFLDDYPSIGSVLWAPPAGQTGFAALGTILSGDTNPSGRTTDTFLRDTSQAPWANNFGQFSYDNMDEYAIDTRFAGASYHVTPSFVNYVEGIYVGYKYYETADDEGAIDYDSVVQYPFGYGLSYTSFTQDMSSITPDGDNLNFTVTVTNTGDVAGKDAVEIYSNPPYTDGGVEKASVNLVTFQKTNELAPGESQTIPVSIALEDLASYDENDAQAYVLDSGDYVLSTNASSHEVLDEETYTVDETTVYSGDNKRESDDVAATNQFDDAEPTFETLSRANGFANFDEVTAAPSSYSMTDEQKAQFINTTNYENVNNDDDQMPTTGASDGPDLYEMYGKSYDDPEWDQILDQLSVDEMNQLIAYAGYGNAEVSSINKPRQTDVDGPSTLNNNFTGVGSIGLPSGISVANTFSPDLARQFGETIGDLAHEMDVTGWYAPAMNIHRTPYAGRNFEYFSEDGVLSGVMASQQIAGAKSKGVYSFMKHFAMNDQEANRMAMIATWSNEQAIREIYLKPFELSVKDGGASAVMGSFNYIGSTWSSSNSHLLENVLRDEWGFRGFVETDYFGGYGYMIGDQAIRSGTDAMLATVATTNEISDRSATSVIAMRNASHNILYTAVNSWIYEDGQPEVATPAWQYVYYVAVVVLGAGLVALEVVAIKRFRNRRKEEAGAETE